MKNCKSLIADGGLYNVGDEDAKSYMNFLWNKMTEEEWYKKWMQSKRSNSYQAMQDRFMSECCIQASCFAVCLFNATARS